MKSDALKVGVELPTSYLFILFPWTLQLPNHSCTVQDIFVRAGRGEFEQFIRISSHASVVGNVPVLLEFTKPNAVFISSRASKERIKCLGINDLRNVR